MITRRLSQLGLMAVISLGLLANAAAQATTPKVGDAVQLPSFTLLDGTTISANSLKGKPVLIEYWASWCPYCRRQNPYWEKLHKSAQGKDIQILSVSIDKKPDEARAYMAEKGYTFQAAMETPEMRQVFGKRKVIPLVFVITPQGKVAEVIPGEMFEEDVLELIKYAPQAPAQ